MKMCDRILNFSALAYHRAPSPAAPRRSRCGSRLPALLPSLLTESPVRLIGSLLLALALCLPVHAETPAETTAPAADGAQLYRIGVDDLVQVSVWRNPELSVTVPVRPDGRISVPLLGDIVAGGRAPDEVAADVEEQLKGYLRDPKVAVILVELRSHEFISRVRVTGAVRTPVSIPYRQGMTVLDAVLQAGGVTEFAAPNRTKLYRKQAGGKAEAIEVRLDAILQRGDLDTNVDVVAGDIITVPERVL